MRFGAEGEPDRVGLCHCLDCRKYHGALFFAAAFYRDDQVKITGEAQMYDGRFFCPVCGSSVLSRTGPEVEVNLHELKPAVQLQALRETQAQTSQLLDLSRRLTVATDRQAVFNAAGQHLDGWHDLQVCLLERDGEGLLRLASGEADALSDNERAAAARQRLDQAPGSRRRAWLAHASWRWLRNR